MYTIVDGDPHGLADVRDFLAVLDRLHLQPDAVLRDLFHPGAEIIVARAPGRLDVMGGIADYSGSLVLEMPIAEATLAALQLSPDPSIHIVSMGAVGNDRSPAVTLDLAAFSRGGQPVLYEQARQWLSADPQSAWAAYAAGTLLVLMREKGLRLNSGLRILIDSRVPEGKGVSSSAAIEVAVMQALAAATGIRLAPRELALLCQTVENRVVGAPCGVMDQMTSACGSAHDLLALLCQPAELQAPVQIPPDLAVWGLDSGVRHSVGGADYGSVRIGAFMGYRIIAELAGLPVHRGEPGETVQIQDERWGGYLANISPSEYQQYYAAELPRRILGADFTERYGGFTDTVTRIDPSADYHVRMPTTHPILEHFRVTTFAELLTQPLTPRSQILMGELMYQSHASYSACGLGSDGTDLLVDLVREYGPDAGLFGAKITGGGSGGTVAILGRADADTAVRDIATLYAEKTGHTPHLFRGSSPGAHACGTLRLRPA